MKIVMVFQHDPVFMKLPFFYQKSIIDGFTTEGYHFDKNNNWNDAQCLLWNAIKIHLLQNHRDVICPYHMRHMKSNWRWKMNPSFPDQARRRTANKRIITKSIISFRRCWWLSITDWCCRQSISYQSIILSPTSEIVTNINF